MQGRRVAILGLGISGISAATLCARLGAEITLSDSKPADDLQGPLRQLEHFTFHYVREENLLPRIGEFDLVIVSPGLSLTNALVQAARSQFIPVVGEIELAFRFCPARIVAVTGTNGKTTTAQLIGDVCNAAELRTFVLGNIGAGFAAAVLDIRSDDIVSLEVSAQQLASTFGLHPSVAIITNLGSEHLDYFADVDSYRAAKLRILANQVSTDVCVLNYDDALCRAAAQYTKARVLYFSMNDVLGGDGVFVRGSTIIVRSQGIEVPVLSVEHLRAVGVLPNALAVLAAALALHSDLSIAVEVLGAFRGFEHVIELFEQSAGIRFYNDSKATNPLSVEHALHAVTGPIILIAGGRDEKKLSFEEMCRALCGKVKALILLGATASRIEDEARRQRFVGHIVQVKNLEEAVDVGLSLANPGDALLLSPGASSADLYPLGLHKERGRKFKELVRTALKVHSRPALPSS